MLNQSIFSEYYLANRKDRGLDGAVNNQPRTEGSLAVANDDAAKKNMVLRRVSSRTWWENGWQNRR